MKIEGSCVTFEPCDAAFVKKFGPLEAANMVLDYHSVHPNMPFLYDAEQLAGFFGISCGELNHIVNHIQKEYKKAFLPKKRWYLSQPIHTKYQTSILFRSNQG